MTEAQHKTGFRDTFESLVVTVILAIFGTTFVVQAFKIPTGSMENTLLIGDHLLVNKMLFASHPRWLGRLLPYREVRRGDIAVFRFPGADDQSGAGDYFVKRVFGLPGDRIRIFHRDVFVNGQLVQEPYVRHAYLNQLRPGDDFPPPPSEYLPGATLQWGEEMNDYVSDGDLVVPPGKYFVMGDNREQSWDSRFWGFVPRDLISGRPLLIYWSYETPRDEYLRTSLSDRFSQVTHMALHFFTRTRWTRTFRFVR